MGKLEERFIKEVIAQEHGYFRPNVVAPSYGLDTSIVTLSDNMAMAVASDPLTYIPALGPKLSAWLSLHLVANDIATTSLAPEYAQVVLNIPDGINEVDLRLYWHYIDQFAKEIGISITGGHTGRALGNHSTIAGGITLWAFAKPEDILLSSHASPGETLFMTKSAAIVSTAILASTFPNFALQHLTSSTLSKVQEEIWNISVLDEATLVRNINQEKPLITAMHDVTEGGILGAVYEMCTASQVAVTVNASDIYVEPHIQELCSAFALDPLRCIGAGAMLLSCKTEHKDILVAAFESKNIRCTEIGMFKALEEGSHVHINQKQEKLMPLEQDPYWEVFNKSIQNGLN